MIYHITTQALWHKAVQNGFYLPKAYVKDGFIHCSNKEQVVVVANRFYAGQSDLLLLAIDIEKVAAEIVHENLEGGTELFPHLYGRLETSSVDSVAPLLPDSSGKFEFPVKWSPNSDN